MEDKAECLTKVPPETLACLGRVVLPLTVSVNPVLTFSLKVPEVSLREACLSVPGYSAELFRLLQCEVAALDGHGP